MTTTTKKRITEIKIGEIVHEHGMILRVIAGGPVKGTGWAEGVYVFQTEILNLVDLEVQAARDTARNIVNSSAAFILSCVKRPDGSARGWDLQGNANRWVDVET